MKFKHGDRVTCTIYGTKITDAKISIDSNGAPYICQNEKDGIGADDKLGYEYSWRLNKDFTGGDVSDLKLAEKTWDNLEVGDVLVDKYENEAMILGICGKVYFISSDYNFEIPNVYPRTIKQLQEVYTIKQETPEPEIEEMTLSQVCEKLGKTIKIIKE